MMKGEAGQRKTPARRLFALLAALLLAGTAGIGTAEELTGGDSLDSNIQLVYNNARLAAATAAALAKLEA